jgi:hypothetical protein
MKFRILVSAAALVGLAGAGTLAARHASPGIDLCCVEHHDCCEGGDASCCAASDTHATDKQWSIITFADPVIVRNAFVSGRVLIVHDDARMARGEPCTTFYRFDAAKGPGEELVSFHCKPRRAAPVSTTKISTTRTDAGTPRLIEYQLRGDSEAHGVPR